MPLPTMSTPPKPTSARTKNRTGPAWQEFNSLPATPPPVAAAETLGRPVVDPPLLEAPPPLLQPKWVAVAGVVAVAAVAVFFIVRGSGKPTQGTPKAMPAPVPVAATPPAPTVRPLPVVVAPPPPDPAPAPVKRHVEISVEPEGATLSLDDHELAGPRIEMDVAGADTTHVVRAEAPGHVPFKKTISFADDVHLDIRLRRYERPRPAPVAAQPPPPREERKPEPKREVKAAPASAMVEDFGMDLQRPAPKRQPKRIDETDPYTP